MCLSPPNTINNREVVMINQKMISLGENNSVTVKKHNKVNDINKKVKDEIRLNKDRIPVNTLLLGKANDNIVLLCVHDDFYTIGNKKFGSLSGAAMYVTGKRRNGREFWKTLDLVSVEDVYKK